MKRMTFFTIISFLMVATAMAMPRSAAAQRDGLGGVLDVLTGVLGGTQRIQGHVVVNRNTTLVLRGDDGRTHALDTSQVDSRLREVLQPGERVTVSLRQPTEAPPEQRPVVAVLRTEPAQTAMKPYEAVVGTVEQTEAERVLFRTREGLLLPADITTIRGLPALTPGQPATLYYEQGRRQELLAVWVEPGIAPPVAEAPRVLPPPGPHVPGVPGPAGGIPGGPPQPAAGIPGAPSAGPGETQRLRGLVESISLTGFVLSADDGRRVTVDTPGLDTRVTRAIRPGDIVTVFARSSDRPDTLIAEHVQPESAAR